MTSPEPQQIMGVVLAGGSGRRIGGNKPFRLLGDRPLIAHVIERFRPQVHRLRISARTGNAAIRSFGIPVLEDAEPDAAGGALAAIVTALQEASASSVALVATAPCDMPFLPHDLVAALHDELAPGAPAVVVTSRSRLHPALGLWRTEALSVVARLFAEGERRMTSICQAVGANELPAERAGWPDEALFNVNTPADLAEAAAILRAPRGQTERQRERGRDGPSG